MSSAHSSPAKRHTRHTRCNRRDRTGRSAGQASSIQIRARTRSTSGCGAVRRRRPRPSRSRSRASPSSRRYGRLRHRRGLIPGAQAVAGSAWRSTPISAAAHCRSAPIASPPSASRPSSSATGSWLSRPAQLSGPGACWRGAPSRDRGTEELATFRASLGGSTWWHSETGFCT